MTRRDQQRRAAKAARRARRLAARPGPRDPVTGKTRGHRTGKRGNRLSDKEQMARTGAGAAKLLDAVAKLPQPTAERAGVKRAAEFAERHRAQWAHLTFEDPERLAA